MKKDNAALLKRIRLSQSPMPMKRQHPGSSGENLPPTLSDKGNFVSPDGYGVKAKRKRVDKDDLDSSIDLFGSPGESDIGLCFWNRINTLSSDVT